jgi:two-component system osmolarity sensor histidine kinase EnvZ
MMFSFLRKKMPQTLFGRSMLILVTPIVLTLFIALFVFFNRHWSTTTMRLTDSLAGEISFVTEIWENEKNPQRQAAIIDQASRNLGLIIQHHPHTPTPKPGTIEIPFLGSHLNTALDNKLDRDFTLQQKDSIVIISVPVKNGLLEVYVPSKRVFSTTTYVFLLFMLGSGLILSIIAVIFMRNQIRPIYKLAVVAEQFGMGIDVPHFKPTGAREIRRAGEAFIEMRDRIKRQIKQRTDMLAGISHDLRTPLTRLRLQMALLPKNIDTDAMQGDVAAMDKMIAGYLDFARGEAMENILRCDIVAILNEAMTRANREGFAVSGDLPDTPVMVTLRAQAMQRVFTNILDNARLYAHSVCHVTFNRRARGLDIIFDDDGPGIPENRREDVFKPFQRLDDSRNQDVEGTGLGLTVSRDLVQSHGGTITLGASPMGGLRVTIELPV